MENSLLLTRLAEKIRTCQKCSLYKTATHAVPGEGNARAQTFFIGEGPGFHEDQTGRPFVGRAGQLLESSLAKIGLSRADVFIGNVVKHRPPENRDPLPSEILACADWLDQQLALIRPKLVVTLGRFSLAKFLPGAKISQVHGRAQKIRGYVVLPMYHPAAALRSGDMMAAFENDFANNKDLIVDPASVEIESDEQENNDDPNQIGLFN